MLRLTLAATSLYLFLCSATVSAWTGPGKDAAEAQAQLKLADQLVEEATHREWYALEQERRELLDQALELAPDHALARWHRGFVRLGGTWVSPSDAVQLFANHKGLTAYEKLRDRSPDTVEGHWEMANWARANGLDLMERAHLLRITRLFPDHAAARRRLGEVKVNEDWVPVGAFWQSVNNSQRIQASLNQYAPIIQRMLKLRSTANESRLQEADRLQDSLRGLDALPAIELMLGYGSRDEALLAVKLMIPIKHHLASQSLARVAVLSPHPDVRQAGGEALGARPLHDYVPLLLTELSSPIESRVDGFTRNGHMFVRHVLVREEKDQHHVEVLDSFVRRRGASLTGDRRLANATEAMMAETLRLMLLEQAARIENQRDLQNVWIALVNRRIAETLAAGTGEVHASPDQWWDWWNQQNEIVVASKATSLNYNSRSTSYAASTPILAGVGGTSVSHECFVAGTLVWTHRGAKAIEKVRVGDLVLAQHPQTGELAFCPVTSTTTRAPEALVRVHTPAGMLEGTGGHPMWVVGEGWMKLSEIRSGMLLHGADGAAPVSRTELGGFATTYNLVVDGAPTYFVGPEKLLCHDNTERGPSSSIIPGGASAR